MPRNHQHSAAIMLESHAAVNSAAAPPTPKRWRWFGKLCACVRQFRRDKCARSVCRDRSGNAEQCTGRTECTHNSPLIVCKHTHAQKNRRPLLGHRASQSGRKGEGGGGDFLNARSWRTVRTFVDCDTL